MANVTAQKALGAYAPGTYEREQPKCPLFTSAIQARCRTDSAYRSVAELALIVVYNVQLHCNADLRRQKTQGIEMCFCKGR
jgi:hypothetical protein